MYYATWLEKIVQEDTYEGGCDGKTETMMLEQINIGADTVADLLKKLGHAYGLDIDDVFIPNDGDGPIFHIGYNRSENNQGDAPNNGQKSLFKRGRIKLWHADYTFAVERRETHPLTLDDFKGIKTH